jgi:ribosomal 50S subunit-associated protein YjgA (DUF615 family)
MNARWLLQLDDENPQRQQVREKLWEELSGETPREAVRAALEASRLGKHQVRRTLEQLLTQAALENEAVWWELYEAIPTCRRATLELGKRISLTFFAQQLPRRQVTLLTEAIERQRSAPLQGYSLLPEGTSVRVALVLALVRQCAQTTPSPELRNLLEPLRRYAPTLTIGSPDLSKEILEVRALIESVTRGLKDLPLPAASAPTTTGLPLPAEGDVPQEPTHEKEETNLWNWLKTKLGDRNG